MSEEKARRDNQGKLEWSLVDFPSFEPMVQVLKWACTDKKPVPYPRDNWKKGMNLDDVYDSLLRHVLALKDEKLDPESKIRHIGHVMCNAMFYSYHETHVREGSGVYDQCESAAKWIKVQLPYDDCVYYSDKPFPGAHEYVYEQQICSHTDQVTTYTLYGINKAHGDRLLEYWNNEDMGRYRYKFIFFKE